MTRTEVEKLAENAPRGPLGGAILQKWVQGNPEVEYILVYYRDPYEPPFEVLKRTDDGGWDREDTYTSPPESLNWKVL